jgi:hypothetical protein
MKTQTDHRNNLFMKHFDIVGTFWVVMWCLLAGSLLLPNISRAFQCKTDERFFVASLDPSQISNGETLLTITNAIVRLDACETYVGIETVSYHTMLTYEGYYKNKCGYVWIYVRTPNNKLGWVKVDEVKKALSSQS